MSKTRLAYYTAKCVPEKVMKLEGQLHFPFLEKLLFIFYKFYIYLGIRVRKSIVLEYLRIFVWFIQKKKTFVEILIFNLKFLVCLVSKNLYWVLLFLQIYIMFSSVLQTPWNSSTDEILFTFEYYFEECLALVHTRPFVQNAAKKTQKPASAMFWGDITATVGPPLVFIEQGIKSTLKNIFMFYWSLNLSLGLLCTFTEGIGSFNETWIFRFQTIVCYD